MNGSGDKPQLHDRQPQASAQLGATVRRAGIDVNDPIRLAKRRFQATAQTPALVAADDHQSHAVEIDPAAGSGRRVG